MWGEWVSEKCDQPINYSKSEPGLLMADELKWSTETTNGERKEYLTIWTITSSDGLVIGACN